MLKHLTSTSNPIIKKAAVLKNKARERTQQNLFIAEGFREIGLALQNGFEADYLFFDPAITAAVQVEELLSKAKNDSHEVIAVTSPIFEKISYRSSVPNIVGIFKAKQTKIDQLQLKDTAPLFLVLEGIEKPGNLGAILRTADAVGVDAVIVCEPNFDLYNPNAIRASLGAIFSVPVFELSSQEAVTYLKANNVQILATWLEAAKPIYSCDMKQPTALVLGAEATGITPFWIQAADQRIIIPMEGQVDSLNVSTSTAIVLFEAKRQRIS